MAATTGKSGSSQEFSIAWCVPDDEIGAKAFSGYPILDRVVRRASVRP
jgi:hypothetical protein